MAITPINSYLDVKNFMNKVLSDNGDLDDTSNSKHGAFWNTLTYQQFVNGTVPVVVDPVTNKPVQILIKGNSAQSNFVMALQGSGPIFSRLGYMPRGGTQFAPDQISSIAAWIDKGCPNPFYIQLWEYLLNLMAKLFSWR